MIFLRELRLEIIAGFLDGSYKKIRNYLQGVENSPAGAYDAGYYFCYNFEIPADRANRSVTRGNLAKDTYWQKYA